MIREGRLLCFHVNITHFHHRNIIIVGNSVDFRVSSFSTFPEAYLNEKTSSTMEFPIMFRHRVSMASQLFHYRLQLRNILFPTTTTNSVMGNVNSNVGGYNFTNANEPTGRRRYLILRLHRIRCSLFFMKAGNVRLWFWKSRLVVPSRDKGSVHGSFLVKFFRFGNTMLLVGVLRRVQVKRLLRVLPIVLRNRQFNFSSTSMFRPRHI